MKNLTKFIFVCAIQFLGAFNLSKADEKTTQLIDEKYSIRIPKNWTSIRYPDDRDCTYIKARKLEYHQEFSLLVCTNTGTPIEIANKKGFYKTEDGWIRSGAMDSQPAKLTTISGHPAIIGNTLCGITTETGFHAAQGDCHSWIIFGSGYGVSFETDGIRHNRKIIDKILSSIVLTNPENQLIHTLLHNDEKHNE